MCKQTKVEIFSERGAFWVKSKTDERREQEGVNNQLEGRKIDAVKSGEVFECWGVESVHVKIAADLHRSFHRLRPILGLHGHSSSSFESYSKQVPWGKVGKNFEEEERDRAQQFVKPFRGKRRGPLIGLDLPRETTAIGLSCRCSSSGCVVVSSLDSQSGGTGFDSRQRSACSRRTKPHSGVDSTIVRPYVKFHNIIRVLSILLSPNAKFAYYT